MARVQGFAFTIFDDTDQAALDKVAPVYDLFHERGLRTTNRSGLLMRMGRGLRGGVTCEDPGYLAWTLDLRARGFEIGYHGATSVTSTRDRAVAGIERFRAIYGHYPQSMSNHKDNIDSIYWGADRLSGGYPVSAYNLMTRFRRSGYSRGHREGDPHFWGDVCQATIRYVRNFTFSDIAHAGRLPRDALITIPNGLM